MELYSALEEMLSLHWEYDVAMVQVEEFLVMLMEQGEVPATPLGVWYVDLSTDFLRRGMGFQPRMTLKMLVKLYGYSLAAAALKHRDLSEAMSENVGGVPVLDQLDALRLAMGPLDPDDDRDVMRVSENVEYVVVHSQGLTHRRLFDIQVVLHRKAEMHHKATQEMRDITMILAEDLVPQVRMRVLTHVKVRGEGLVWSNPKVFE